MLRPKPDKIQRHKKDWKYLDGILQNKFQNSYHEHPELTIHLDEYIDEMNAHDIKNEAEKNGYKVTVHEDGNRITFE